MHDTDQGRRLVRLPDDGGAHKPDEIKDKVITVMDVISTRMPDGRDTMKMVVLTDTGETKVYYVPGQNPALALRDWFRRYVGAPLRCRLYRVTNQYGTEVWNIEQVGDTPERESVDDQLTEGGLGI